MVADLVIYILYTCIIFRKSKLISLHNQISHSPRFVSSSMPSQQSLDQGLSHRTHSVRT